MNANTRKHIENLITEIRKLKGSANDPTLIGHVQGLGEILEIAVRVHEEPITCPYCAREHSGEGWYCPHCGSC